MTHEPDSFDRHHTLDWVCDRREVPRNGGEARALTMGQSSVIFAYLVIAFLVYITMKGELPTYMGFLFASRAGAAGNTKLAGGSTTNTPVGFASSLTGTSVTQSPTMQFFGLNTSIPALN